MAITINIQPVELVKFPEQKFATKIHIYNVQVNLVDRGVSFEYSLMDEQGDQLFISRNTLNNEEVSNWTTTDEQLIDAVLIKLGLSKR